MGKREVSVIVPVRNGEDVIEECVRSMVEQKNVQCQMEIIIVDNRSTGGTINVVEKWPVRPVKEETKLSSYASRNRGIQAASGEYLVFTDSDYIASPHWVATGERPVPLGKGTRGLRRILRIDKERG